MSPARMKSSDIALSPSSNSVNSLIKVDAGMKSSRYIVMIINFVLFVSLTLTIVCSKDEKDVHL